MININKVITNIFDSQSGITVFSDLEMDYSTSVIKDFVIKHIDKSFVDSSLKYGEFLENSSFKQDIGEYLKDGLTFEDFAKGIAEDFFELVKISDKVESSDLMVCDITSDSQRFIAIINLINKTGFMHQVVNESGKIRNNIIQNFAILPTTTQRIAECVFVDLSTLKIKYCDKLRYIDGHDVHIFPDKILQCSSSLSSKESMNLVKNITKMVAESNGLNATSVISHAKNYIVENSEISDSIDTLQFSREVFPTSEIMQHEFVEQVKQAGIKDKISMPKVSITKSEKNQKIKTDTGVEITFPVDYFHNKDFIEFINNPDGTISIQIKNINKIVNR